MRYEQTLNMDYGTQSSMPTFRRIMRSTRWPRSSAIMILATPNPQPRSHGGSEIPMLATSEQGPADSIRLQPSKEGAFSGLTVRTTASRRFQRATAFGPRLPDNRR